MMTVTAWESVEAIDQLMRMPAHREAMSWMYGNDVADGGAFSLWQPVRMSMVRRCPVCRSLTDTATDGATCSCGSPVPQRHPWF